MTEPMTWPLNQIKAALDSSSERRDVRDLVQSGARSVRVISEEKVVQLIEAVVHDALGESRAVDPAERDRLVAQAKAEFGRIASAQADSDSRIRRQEETILSFERRVEELVREKQRLIEAQAALEAERHESGKRAHDLLMRAMKIAEAAQRAQAVPDADTAEAEEAVRVAQAAQAAQVERDGLHARIARAERAAAEAHAAQASEVARAAQAARVERDELLARIASAESAAEKTHAAKAAETARAAQAAQAAQVERDELLARISHAESVAEKTQAAEAVEAAQAVAAQAAQAAQAERDELLARIARAERIADEARAALASQRAPAPEVVDRTPQGLATLHDELRQMRALLAHLETSGGGTARDLESRFESAMAVLLDKVGRKLAAATAFPVDRRVEATDALLGKMLDDGSDMQSNLRDIEVTERKSDQSIQRSLDRLRKARKGSPSV
jgi:hypothetical protein